MKLNKILFGTFMIATVGLMCACSSDDDNGGGGNNPQEREKEVKGEMKKAELLGFVKDTNGNPLAGVKGGSGTAVTTTDATGAFALTDIEVVKGRTVVDFSKEGYFDIVRSYTEASKDKWEVVMVSKANNTITTNATYNASSAKTLKTNAGMEVKMPADGYKDAKTGKDYTGTVKSEMLYLNPDDDNFATMMPGGDLAAVDASNQNVQLISYGMTKVEMTDQNGNALQLKNIPLGLQIHNIEMTPGRGGKIVRSAGQYAVLRSREGDYCQVKLPSGEVRMFHINCLATIGQVGNLDHMNVSLGKAGKARYKGFRPHVRGVVQNPIDHPMGGGEGRSSGGGHPVSPWGQLAKGKRTRHPKKPSNKFIVERRRK